MNRLPKPLRAFFACLVIAIVVHAATGYFLFDVDLLQAVGQRSQGPLMAVTFLVLSRGFLYFVAPPWGLYLLVRTIVEEQMRKNAQMKAGQTPERRDNVDS